MRFTMEGQTWLFAMAMLNTRKSRNGLRQQTARENAGITTINPIPKRGKRRSAYEIRAHSKWFENRRLLTPGRWIHFDRTAGRDCRHRHSRGVVVANFEPGRIKRQIRRMQKQPAPTRPGFDYVCGRLREIPGQHGLF